MKNNLNDLYSPILDQLMPNKSIKNQSYANLYNKFMDGLNEDSNAQIQNNFMNHPRFSNSINMRSSNFNAQKSLPFKEMFCESMMGKNIILFFLFNYREKIQIPFKFS